MISTRYNAVALGGLICIGAASAAATAATANGSCTFKDITPSAELSWCKCGTNFFCAKLKVPLDYKNNTRGHAAVPLLKYAASSNSTDGPYQGMLVVIPGGPGGSGVETLHAEATTLQGVVGSNWDLVSYDPRGIARSEPLLHCSAHAPALPADHTRRDGVPRATNDFYTSYLRYGEELGKRCAQQAGDAAGAGPHMSTAVNARDLISLVDAYAGTAESHLAAKNSRLLNFWAFSYGTVVGQTFSSMFPGRVGNGVLDGIVNAPKYQAGWVHDSINRLDGVLAMFFIYCSDAGSSLCPYTVANNTAQDTFARFRASLTQLDARRAEAQHWENATTIAKALVTLKYTAFSLAYSPLTSFSNMSQVFLGLETALNSGTLKQWTRWTIAANGNPGPSGLANWQWLLGVACSDQSNLYYGKTLHDFQPTIRGLEAQSILGEIWMRNVLGCAGWKIKADDLFQGPYGGDTATPLLFVSNTYDPVTPIINSNLEAPKYKNAQIIKADGAGHTSEATLNKCSLAKIRAYFQETQLPDDDNFCAAERGPFGVKLKGTLKQNIQKAGLSDLHF